MEFCPSIQSSALPGLEEEKKTDTRTREERTPLYNVIVWNDPVNTMSFVTFVFQRIFGWDKTKAEKHMLEVHNQGQSVLITEEQEKAEMHVHQLQSFSLHATMEPDV